MNYNQLSQGTILQGRSYKYKIEKVLGQGSFGITYLATTRVKVSGALGELETTMKVAVKEFFMKDINEREGSSVSCGSKDGLFDHYKRKFAKEAENLSRVNHPYIIKVLESFEANNTHYYTMEYCEGGSLEILIKNHGRVNEKDAKRFMKQIGDALTFMHGNRMLHLDLKPSNIMLRENGDIALIDFGLSKQYGQDGTPESSTTIGGGTPGYAPLEQSSYREGKEFPVTMDVYAFGATLYKMLTGERPAEASILLNEGFPSEDLRLIGIPDRTISCIEKAMSPMKKQRYASIADFVSDYLNNGNSSNENTEFIEPNTVVKPQHINHPAETESRVTHETSEPKFKKPTLFLLIIILVLSIIGGWFLTKSVIHNSLLDIEAAVDSTAIDSTLTVPAGPAAPQPPARPVKKSLNKTITVNGVSFEMIYVKGGSFTMGAGKGYGYDNEKPAHEVSLSDFYIGKFEVTQGLWKAVMGNNPSRFKNGDDYPVEKISWDDCQKFIQKLNNLTGKSFSLPTEAQWEYAARSGKHNEGFKYSGSNTINDIAWYSGNSDSSTHHVGSKNANALGLYDMSGNVWEWCSDLYGSSGRAIRGGSYGYEAHYCNIFFGFGTEPSLSHSNIGFRLVLVP